MPSLRAEFAEQVMLDLVLKELDKPQDEQYGVLAAALIQTVIAIVHLAEVALHLWLDENAGVVWDGTPPNA